MTARYRWFRAWVRTDRGSVTAELVIVTPLLVMLLLFVAVVVHRSVTARLRLDDVAHQAARAAALERTPTAAHHAAHATATTALSTAGLACVSIGVDTNLGTFAPGGTIRVSVRCRADLGDALLLGVPGSRTVSATAVEPLDAWRSTADTEDQT